MEARTGQQIPQMRKYSASGLCALSGVFLTGASAHGLEATDFLLYSKGSYSLRPHLDVAQIFNDNVYYRNDEKVHDLITLISPGLTVQLGTEDANFISLTYNFDRLQYWSESDQSANQHRIALGSHVVFNRLTLEGRDEIEMLSSVLGGGISLGGQQVDRTTYFDEYRLTYEFSARTGVYIEGSHISQDFEEGIPLFDSNTLRGTAGFQYRAFSRSFLFGEIYYGQSALNANYDAPKPPHAEFVGGFVGVHGFFTEKLTGSVKAGYEAREFSDGTPGGSLPVVEAELTERFTEKTVLTGTYSRRQQVSVQFARAAYSSDTIGLALRQEIGNDGRFRALARASFMLADYEPHPSFDQRTDHLIFAGVELNYDFKIWLKGRLAYNYEHLDSDLGTIVDYDVNRVTLGLTIGY